MEYTSFQKSSFFCKFIHEKILEIFLRITIEWDPIMESELGCIKNIYQSFTGNVILKLCLFKKVEFHLSPFPITCHRQFITHLSPLVFWALQNTSILEKFLLNKVWIMPDPGFYTVVAQLLEVEPKFPDKIRFYFWN